MSGVGVILAWGAIVTFGAFLLLWLVSVAARDASIVDPFWGLAFVIVSLTALVVAGEPRARQVLAVALVSLWGLRLSVYLAARNLGKGEDYRYRAMRRRWGKRFPLVSLGTVFILQASLVWVVSLPVQATMAGDANLTWVTAVGTAVWAIGVSFEAIADWQLARFRRDPKNRGAVMDGGLWKYTRHPNYFGDFCVWWGIFLVSFQTSLTWTIIGPLLMSLLLLRVSGVALLERTISQRRPGYREYAERTPAFFPWKPKSQPAPSSDRSP